MPVTSPDDPDKAVQRLVVLNQITDAALTDLAAHEAARTGGNPLRMRSAVIRRLILQEQKRLLSATMGHDAP
jgi:hypothetical protein